MSAYRFAALLASAAVVSGCSGGGIWMITLDPAAQDECVPEVTHNFMEAYVADETSSDWTVTEEESTSGQLFFAQLIEGFNSEGVLIIDDVAYPGTSDGSAWTFEWTSSGDVSGTSSYMGYSFTEDKAEAETTKITLTIDGKTGSGSFSMDYSLSEDYTETDQRDNEEVGNARKGDIPSNRYLVKYDAMLEEEIAVSNQSEDADCSGTECELSITTSCSGSQSFTAVLTGYDAEYDFESLEDAGQAPGVF